MQRCWRGPRGGKKTKKEERHCQLVTRVVRGVVVLRPQEDGGRNDNTERSHKDYKARSGCFNNSICIYRLAVVFFSCVCFWYGCFGHQGLGALSRTNVFFFSSFPFPFLFFLFYFYSSQEMYDSALFIGVCVGAAGAADLAENKWYTVHLTRWMFFYFYFFLFSPTRVLQICLFFVIKDVGGALSFPPLAPCTALAESSFLCLEKKCTFHKGVVCDNATLVYYILRSICSGCRLGLPARVALGVMQLASGWWVG